MLSPMRVLSSLALAAALSLSPALAWAAAIVDQVQIKGLNEDDETQAAMAENIRVALTLNDALGKRLLRADHHRHHDPPGCHPGRARGAAEEDRRQGQGRRRG